MRATWADADDALLARDIFGTEDRRVIERVIGAWLTARGHARSRVIAIELSVGAAVTVALPGRRRLFVKVWPGTVAVTGLAAQIEVQRRLGTRGFPAPGLRGDLASLGGGWAIAMDYDRSGEPADATGPRVRDAMARGLADLIAQAGDLRDLRDLPRLDLPPPERIWPKPHNALFDFDATGDGAAWIDALAADALATLRALPGRHVVGHNDWSAKNLRMRGDGLAVVYDWDSIFLAPEALIVGTAATHFPATSELDLPRTPLPDATRAFVGAYEARRGTPFSTDERIAVAAGATYARAYTARCEHARDPDGVDWSGSARASLRAHGAVTLTP